MFHLHSNAFVKYFFNAIFFLKDIGFWIQRPRISNAQVHPTNPVPSITTLLLDAMSTPVLHYTSNRINV